MNSSESNPIWIALRKGRDEFDVENYKRSLRKFILNLMTAIKDNPELLDKTIRKFKLLNEVVDKKECTHNQE